MAIIRILAVVLWIQTQLGYAQSPTPAQLAGTWIGESVEVDIGWVRPLTWRMTFRPDSTVQLTSMSQRGVSRTVNWRIKDRVVQMDSITFSASQWRLSGDQLYINGWEPQRYRLLKPVPMDSASVRQTISNRTWNTDSLSYSLFEDGSVCLESLKTSDIALYYWHLVPVEESLFLIIRGTQMERDILPHYPLQVIQIANNSLTVRGWNGKRWGDFSLVRTANLKPDQSCRPTGFQLCNTFLAPGDQKYPYYEYKKGRLGMIRRIVAREYQPVSDAKPSGLVRFRFVVNCQGKAGMFEMLTLDENYKRCQFDTRITDQLRRICEGKIMDWEPGKGTGTDKDNVYDTVCLLTFRFKDG